MKNKKGTSVNTKENEQKEIKKSIEEILNDPELGKEIEEYQKKYGTLTQEELNQEFTI